MPFGEFVRTRREQLALTQTGAAVAAGLSLGQWQKIEYGRSGRPTNRTLQGIAKALHLDVLDVRRAQLRAEVDTSEPEPVAGDAVDLGSAPDLDEVLKKVQDAMDAMEAFKRAHERKERR